MIVFLLDSKTFFMLYYQMVSKGTSAVDSRYRVFRFKGVLPPAEV